MDAERLTEIRERWAAATPGPWCHRHANDGVKRTPLPEVCSEGAARGDWRPTVASTSYDEAIANAAAIAAAPTDIADLLAEVERLRADAKHLRRPARRVVAAFDMFNAAPASPDTVWNLVSEQVEQLRAAIAADALAGGDA